MKKQRAYLLFALAIASFSTVSGQVSAPNILLTVDISPSTTPGESFNLIVNAAPGLSLATNNANSSPSFNFNDGFTLANLFVLPATFDAGSVASSTLTTALDGKPIYDTFQVDDLSTGDSSQSYDLNVFSGKGDPHDDITEDFTEGIQAFATPGAITGEIPGVTAASFAPDGFIGDIYAGYSEDYPGDTSDTDAINADADPLSGLVLLGQYEVIDIPEPSQCGLLLLGAAGLVALGRRRAVGQIVKPGRGQTTGAQATHAPVAAAPPPREEGAGRPRAALRPRRD